MDPNDTNTRPTDTPRIYVACLARLEGTIVPDFSTVQTATMAIALCVQAMSCATPRMSISPTFAQQACELPILRDGTWKTSDARVGEYGFQVVRDSRYGHRLSVAVGSDEVYSTGGPLELIVRGDESSRSKGWQLECHGRRAPYSAKECNGKDSQRVICVLHGSGYARDSRKTKLAVMTLEAAPCQAGTTSWAGLLARLDVEGASLRLEPHFETSGWHPLHRGYVVHRDDEMVAALEYLWDGRLWYLPGKISDPGPLLAMLYAVWLLTPSDDLLTP
ncbi:hypothetical protein ACFL6C_10145 [Myxococcota bacterium]